MATTTSAPLGSRGGHLVFCLVLVGQALLLSSQVTTEAGHSALRSLSHRPLLPDPAKRGHRARRDFLLVVRLRRSEGSPRGERTPQGRRRPSRASALDGARRGRELSPTEHRSRPRGADSGKPHGGRGGGTRRERLVPDGDRQPGDGARGRAERSGDRGRRARRVA